MLEPGFVAISAVRAAVAARSASYAPHSRRLGAVMSSGNDAVLDDYDEADSLDDVMRKSRENFPKMCDSKNEAGEFDNSLHEARLKNYMERLAVACERRGFADVRKIFNLYQKPANYQPAAAAPAPIPVKVPSKAAKPPPAPPAPEPAAAELAVGAKPKKPAKRKSPAREPVEESEFEKWVKTRPWYPLFREARPWYPDEKPSPAKKPKSEK